MLGRAAGPQPVAIAVVPSLRASRDCGDRGTDSGGKEFNTVRRGPQAARHAPVAPPTSPPTHWGPAPLTARTAFCPGAEVGRTVHHPHAGPRDRAVGSYAQYARARRLASSSFRWMSAVGCPDGRHVM